MKVCNTCKESKELSEYMISRRNLDGYCNKCNSCYEATILSMPGMPVRHSKKTEILDNDLKNKARNACMRMLPIVKDRHRHHWSYNKDHWLDVILLTPANHLIAHKYLVYDTRSKKYLDISGHLLNTREKHEAYLKLMLQWHGLKRAA